METRTSKSAVSAGRKRRSVATPAAILGAEHDLLLDVARVLALRLGEPGTLDRAFWRDAVSFLRSFGTRHHAKENIVLVAALEHQGTSSSEGPLRAMVEEHAEEALRLEAVAKLLDDVGAGDPDAEARFRQAAREYCEHLVQHVDHESRHLLPTLEQQLSPQDEREVVHRFLLYGHAADGEDQYDQLLAIADRLRRGA